MKNPFKKFPFVVYSERFLNIISITMKIGGIALFPFVFVRKKYKTHPRGKYVINHEKIHIKQQMELLIIPFYFIYFLFFFINMFRFGSMSVAYTNIPFEKEANAKENKLDYLKDRKLYSWVKYI